MIEHPTPTLVNMDRVVFLNSAVNSARGFRSWRRRGAWIAISIALLSMTGAITAALFYLNDPYWVKWGVGLVLAFNGLVAARFAFSRRRAYADR